MVYSPGSIRIGGKSLSEALAGMYAEPYTAERMETIAAHEAQEKGLVESRKVHSYICPPLSNQNSGNQICVSKSPEVKGIGNRQKVNVEHDS